MNREGEKPLLRHLGLGGDGDEVDAIEAVERRFGIAFDHEDCERFVTVGDVWAALLKETRRRPDEAADMWAGFVEELCDEVGADPQRIGLETELIGGDGLLVQIWEWLARRR